MNVGINHFIFLSAIMLGLGIYTIITQRNIIRIYLGVTLVLLSPFINFAAFGNIKGFNPDTQIILFIILAICILLLVIGAMIFYNYFKESGSAELEK